MEQLHPLIEVCHLRVQGVESNWLSADVKGRYQRIVVEVEAGQDEGDEFVVFHGSAGSRKLVGERPRPGEVDGDGLVALLQVGEGDAKIVDAGAGLRREHVLQRSPGRVRRLDRHHLREDLLGDGAHQIGEHLLVLGDPDRVQWVGGARRLAFLVGAGEKLLWLGSGSIKVSIEGGGSDLGKKLSLPQKVIFTS